MGQHSKKFVRQFKKNVQIFMRRKNFSTKSKSVENSGAIIIGLCVNCALKKRMLLKALPENKL